MLKPVWVALHLRQELRLEMSKLAPKAGPGAQGTEEPAEAEPAPEASLAPAENGAASAPVAEAPAEAEKPRAEAGRVPARRLTPLSLVGLGRGVRRR